MSTMLLDVPRLEVSLKVSDASRRLPSMLPWPFALPRDATHYVSFHQSPLPLPFLTWITFSRYEVVHDCTSLARFLFTLRLLSF